MMIYVKYKYKVRTGWHRLYAIGAHGAVVRALRATFTDHGMRIQQEKGTTLVHFPGGWLDRAASAYNRSMSVMGGPLANSFTLAYTRTDNAAVTLVDVQLYHKTSFISNRLTESRIGKFFSALQQEAAIGDIALVAADDWPAVLRDHPELRCSPYWPTEAEIQARLKAQGLEQG